MNLSKKQKRALPLLLAVTMILQLFIPIISSDVFAEESNEEKTEVQLEKENVSEEDKEEAEEIQLKENNQKEEQKEIKVQAEDEVETKQENKSPAKNKGDPEKENVIKTKTTEDFVTNLDMDKLKMDIDNYVPYVFVYIEGYEGDLPDNPIFPTEKDIIKYKGYDEGSIIEAIDIKGFDNKGINGELTIHDSYYIGSAAFKDNNITRLNITGNSIIGNEAFKNNNIRSLEFSNVSSISKEAFMNNEIEGTIENNKIKNLPARVFMNNKISRVNMNSVKEIETGALRDNLIQKVSIENVETIKANAFINNKIKELNAEKLITVGNMAFFNNEIELLNAEKLDTIGNGAFRNNKIKEAKIYNVSVLGDYAFFNNNLKNIYMGTKPTFGKNVFGNNAGSYDYVGYFPVFTDAIKEENKLDSTARVIINPTNQFIEDKVKELEKDNKVYLYRTEKDSEMYGYAVAQDDTGNSYYCVSEYTTFTQGVFERKPINEVVYVVQHGKSKDLEDKESSLPVQKQIVSIDKKPEAYKIGYESDLISKLIYHSNSMITEQGLERKSNETIKLVHSIVSNLEVEGVVLTSSNVLENIKNTSNYERIIDIFGEDFINELFNRIKTDSREYTQAIYMEYVNNELNYDGVEFSQSVILPGEPVNEKIDLPVIKKWENDNETDRPDFIEIDLLKDGKVLETVKLTPENDWKHEFKGLDKTDDKGKEIEYTVEEVPIDGYDVTIDGNVKDGYTITNTEIVPPTPIEPATTSVDVEKVWEGKALDSVTINLLADGKEVDSIDLSKDNDWKHTFTGLPTVNDITDEETIEYTVEELTVDGYDVEITNEGNSFTVTNTEIIVPEEPTDPEPEEPTNPEPEEPTDPEPEDKLPQTGEGINILAPFGIILIIMGLGTLISKRYIKE